MAVIKFGSIVTDGRGSLGGSTIQSDRSGHIWRNKPLPLKSRSPAQSLIRSYNKTMQAGWRDLSEADKRIWNDFPKINHIFNKSGEKHPLSGHSFWMKQQYRILANGYDLEPNVNHSFWWHPLMRWYFGTFYSGTEEWIKYGNNLLSVVIEEGRRCLRIESVDNVIGAECSLYPPRTLLKQLTNGVSYNIQGIVKTTNPAVRVRLDYGAAGSHTFGLSTSFTRFNENFTASIPGSPYWRFQPLAPGDVVFVSDWYIDQN